MCYNTANAENKAIPKLTNVMIGTIPYTYHSNDLKSKSLTKTKSNTTAKNTKATNNKIDWCCQPPQTAAATTTTTTTRQQQQQQQQPVLPHDKLPQVSDS
jgi:hypothetical protein